jgi:hypothetical protein
MASSDADLREAVAEFRGKALDALAAGRPMVAYDYAQAWISHDGVRTLGPWLVEVANALQLGQGRTAVHAADLALKHWIGDDTRRAVLRYVRGEVIRRHLKDPKTAQADLDAALDAVPSWLREDAEKAAALCRDGAAVSRKRKPSVSRAPEYVAAVNHPNWSDCPVELDEPIEDEPPFVWQEVERVLMLPDPRVPADTRWER